MSIGNFRVGPFLAVAMAAVFSVIVSSTKVFALGDAAYVSTLKQTGDFPLVSGERIATLYIDEGDHRGVHRALGDLQRDIEKVSTRLPNVVSQQSQLTQYSVIVGTIGLSPLVDRLIANGKVDPSAIVGKWDAFHLEVVDEPVGGVERALVIIGADRRGTTYGIYDVSEQIGVSPWYYWADVPVSKKDALYIAAGTRVQQAPAVKYRGIFLNDEAPALSSWVRENHGDFTHEFYEKVFELLLRLKANFLWPAMWNNAFADDDIQNMTLADEYGIVMSTSHHEPMMRADKEWDRHGVGAWDYDVNPKELEKFWTDGAKRNKDYESIYTMGMRGQQDTPMTEGENIELLEDIVKAQRSILSNTFTDRDVSEVPQVWCLYKEVQAYYEKGMRVPDDIILLWSDDNWGNIRRLPTPEERARSGGAGVYYHFDYVGGPRSYRWINVVPLAKIWEQMHLAWKYEATQIWITNVGDLKPMEYPIEFFLNMAWNPERWGRENIEEFSVLWAEREFGKAYAKPIAKLMTAYTRHNGRRKPELMAPDTYSVLHYGEAERIEAELLAMVDEAEALSKKLPKEKQDAFFQLVLHPVKASAIVTRMNIAVARNRLYAHQGRANANDYAKEAKALFKADSDLKREYHSINNGKWNGFMNQSHIGYRYWNNPEADQQPVTYDYSPGDYGEIGVAVEGQEIAWPTPGSYSLTFDQLGQKTRSIELFNRGTREFDYSLSPSAEWIKLSTRGGKLAVGEKVSVSIDWEKLPVGTSTGSVSIRGTSWVSPRVNISAKKHAPKILKQAQGFVEADGYIAIEAENFSKRKAVDGYNWEVIPQHGRTQSSVSVYPINDTFFKKAGKGPMLEYELTFTEPGEVEVQTFLAPTWPLMPGRELRYAVAIGKEKPQVVTPLMDFNGTDWQWEQTVRDGVRVARSKHTIKKAGPTTLRIYMMEPALTLQKIVIDTGGLKPSYLGPQQSPHH